MKAEEIFKYGKLEQCFVIGYFGGTNFGDELLLEIFQNLLFKNGVKSAKIYYTKPDIFKEYHHDFGYKLVNPSRISQLVKAIVSSRSIVIGGGGHWGLDSNLNILLLGIILFLARYILSKDIYLVSVGFYDSVNKYGRLSAFFSALAANKIYARDQESYDNFSKYSNSVVIDEDLSTLLPQIDGAPYYADAKNIIESYSLKDTQIIFGVRRFTSLNKSKINIAFVEALKLINDQKVAVFGFENLPETRDLIHWYKTQVGEKSNIAYYLYNRNPLALFFALRSLSINSIFAPQYHVQIIAQLSKIPFFPLAYDNKVSQMHKKYFVKTIAVSAITPNMLIDFVK